MNMTLISRLKQALVLLCSASLLLTNLTAYAADAGGGGVEPNIICMDCGTTTPPPPSPAQPATVTRYVITDRLGNPVAKTNSVGVVIWRQTYTPYGETDQQPDPDGPGFTGHRHDAATGLVYMQARYYDPKIGRFLSPDPVTFSPHSHAYFNRYWYAKGNPYRYTDPDGRNFTMGLAGLLYEAYSAVTGNGFHGDRVAGAFADGYNGEGDGVVAAAVQDISTITAAVSGVGAFRAIATKGAAEATSTIAANAAKGKAGEAITRAKLGKNIAGEQVSFKTSDGTRARPDFVTKGKDVVETKTGNARLSPGQAKLKADIDAGRSVTPVGKNAQDAGLKPGTPTKMTSCTVDRC
ncbi:MAG TPA: RHS repeat-associated core domain-containing protein [Gammaproteobacteria bacterium]|nr:RHS repeat-associated core domain-containing protein [Gammaproteobacteria bacterium]